MKKNISTLFKTFLFSILTFNFTFGQEYEFSTFNTSYIELQNATDITNEVSDANTSLIFPFASIGFEFNFLDYSTNHIQIAKDFIVDTSTVNGVIEGIRFLNFSSFYNENNLEPNSYSYKTITSNGSNVFILQYNNIKFQADTIGGQYINYQLKLYDVDDAIELCFGPSNVTQQNLHFGDSTGGMILFTKIMDWVNGVINPLSFSLIGTINTPEMIPYSIFSQNEQITIYGIPTNGTVYRFAPKNNSISKLHSNDYKIYPNPTKNKLEIITNKFNCTVEIKTITGQKMGETIEFDNSQIINVSNLTTGTYFAEIKSMDGIKTMVFSIE